MKRRGNVQAIAGLVLALTFAAFTAGNDCWHLREYGVEYVYSENNRSSDWLDEEKTVKRTYSKSDLLPLIEGVRYCHDCSERLDLPEDQA